MEAKTAEQIGSQRNAATLKLNQKLLSNTRYISLESCDDVAFVRWLLHNRIAAATSCKVYSHILSIVCIYTAVSSGTQRF